MDKQSSQTTNTQNDVVAHSNAVARSADFDEALRRFFVILDSGFVAMAVLLLLLLVLVGIGNPILFIMILFMGCALIQYFESVKRVVALGGSVWLIVLIVGGIVGSCSGPVFFDMAYLFGVCGFMAALCACCTFFVGCSFYEAGRARGERDADHLIAANVVEKLIDNPDEWTGIDGSFLETEGALARVRDRERAASERLQNESRRKDDLVTYLAHDLKTPLASVVGYLSLLQEAPDLPVEQRARFTGVALDKAHRLDALIEEFFDITRFDFHDIVLTRGYVDLSFMLAQVADEFYPSLAEQHKQVHIDTPPTCTILMDGDKMARVFNNVMKNALAYSYENSTIEISAHQEEDTVVVRFQNQGDPIPEAKLKVIFDKFYRLDAARATNRGGAGLGLAIAREIVVAHGGTIECTSTPEATVFTIVLPAETPVAEQSLPSADNSLIAS